MTIIHSTINTVTAFAPATCANVAVGFDILGFAFPDVGDYVTLTRRADQQIIIDSIESLNSDETIPFAVEKNTASVVLHKACEELKITTGFSLRIRKGIPLSSGMGGSAASAVAALVALNGFLQSPLPLQELARYALFGEAVASGQAHADNIVPCLFGGLTLIRSLDPIEVIRLPLPDVYCVLIHPHLHVPTEKARRILKKAVLLGDVVQQTANLAAFISALYTNDKSVLQTSLIDCIIEPQRVSFVPGFHEVKAAGLAAGALGVSFSGSGPSVFAFANDESSAKCIQDAMRHVFQRHAIESDGWMAKMCQTAAAIKKIE